ncbi:MAG: methyltransferase domain-containing protein [Polaromonas sp.]|nr:methyltransferase domain-containing protein [Polaromonas sp.]
MKKQVDKDHYKFSEYLTKARWASVWHQLDEVMKFKPARVLEIGPGPGIFKSSAKTFGLNVETLDVDPELNPDYVASIFSMPFKDNEIDVVCAFQVLEHLPYDKSLQAFAEMVRISKTGVVISLPDAKRVWPMTIHIPKIGVANMLIPRPFLRLQTHDFDGEHYWEINKLGYALDKLIKDFKVMDCQLIRTYRVFWNPYHRFFIFSKQVENSPSSTDKTA